MDKEKFEPKTLLEKVTALNSLIETMYISHQYKYENAFEDAYKRASKISLSTLQLATRLDALNNQLIKELNKGK